MSNLKVDPDKVEELAAEYKSLSRLIEEEETGIHSELLSLIYETNNEYPEDYVRRTTREMEELLREIRNLAKEIVYPLDDQAKTLQQTAEKYRQDEKKVQKIMQQEVGFSLTKSKGITVNRTSKFGSASTTVQAQAGIKLPADVDPLKNNLSMNPKKYSKEVKKLQERLKDMGYDVKVDGYFGKQTLAAVNHYKNKYGLANEGANQGVVDNQTWLYLFSRLSGELKHAPTTYSEYVKMAQIRLQEVGYTVGTTGYFDDQMLMAVNKFKDDQQLGNTGSWAGVLGAQTWGVLFGALAAGAPTANNTKANQKANKEEENATTYVVQKGDTLNAIAKKLKTTVAELAKLNNITNVNKIAVGQLLKVPNVKESLNSIPVIMPGSESSTGKKTGSVGGITYVAGMVLEEGVYKGWKVTQGFNDLTTNHKGHLGLDIINNELSTSIKPVFNGKVVFIDNTNKKANGNIVVIEHEINGVKFYSSYSHLANSSIPKTLKVGDPITVNDKIGVMGGTGGKKNFGSHLHLMIYTGGISGNPKGYSSDGYTKFKDPTDYYTRDGKTFYDVMKVINSNGQIIINNNANKISNPKPNIQPKETDNTTNKSNTYVVKRGDTLSAIAKKLKTTVAELAKLNNITNVNKVAVGQILKVPNANVIPTPKPDIKPEVKPEVKPKKTDNNSKSVENISKGKEEEGSDDIHNTVQAPVSDEWTGHLVTVAQLKEFGWSDTNDAFLKKLNDALTMYGITDKESIALFMATMAAESSWGRYKLELGNEAYWNSNGYKGIERGAGYIQITWRATHLKFLKSTGDSFSGDDTAAYIAKNYPMEASAWFWSKAAKTGDGNLNAYVTKNGSGLGMFLNTQYFVNGLVTKNGKVAPGFMDDLSYIRNGGSFMINKDAKGNSTSLSVNGHTWRLPNNWDDRAYAYNKAIKAFCK